QQAKRLDGVEAAVAAVGTRNIVLADPAILPQFGDRGGERVVLGQDRAGIADRAEILGRVKAEGRNVAERAGASVATHGAMRLRAILDDPDIAAAEARKLRTDRLHIVHDAVEMCDDDRPAAGGERRAELAGVELEA